MHEQLELLSQLWHFEMWIRCMTSVEDKLEVVEGRLVDRRTDGSRLDHVADGESLDCLVLWSATGAVGATDWVNVSASLLVTSIGRALLDHFGGFWRCC